MSTRHLSLLFSAVQHLSSCFSSSKRKVALIKDGVDVSDLETEVLLKKVCKMLCVLLKARYVKALQKGKIAFFYISTQSVASHIFLLKGYIKYYYSISLPNVLFLN